jgi:plastocyanin
MRIVRLMGMRRTSPAICLLTLLMACAGATSEAEDAPASPTTTVATTTTTVPAAITTTTEVPVTVTTVIAAVDTSVATTSTITTPPTVTDVVIKNVSFSPSTISVAVGDVVAWHWQDGGIPHNVTFASFASPVMSVGVFSRTFAAAGTYAFRCTLHRGMSGTVIVS